MPGLNRRGPTGTGPMTGRQLGRCAENDEGISSRRFGDFERRYRGGCGGGRGRGLGYGWRNRFGYRYEDSVSDEILLENEAKALKDQLSYLEKELGKIREGKMEE